LNVDSIKLNSNSIEGKWDEKWYKMDWKFSCDDGVEKKNFEKSQIWSKHLSNPLYLICIYHPTRQLLEPKVALPKPILINHCQWN
jgi:hypothetical protein